MVSRYTFVPWQNCLCVPARASCGRNVVQVCVRILETMTALSNGSSLRFSNFSPNVSKCWQVNAPSRKRSSQKKQWSVWMWKVWFCSCVLTSCFVCRWRVVYVLVAPKTRAEALTNKWRRRNQGARPKFTSRWNSSIMFFFLFFFSFFFSFFFFVSSFLTIDGNQWNQSLTSSASCEKDFIIKCWCSGM